MNIDGLGGETIDLLIQEGLISEISDLYLLEKEDVLPLERIAEKSAENLILGLKASKKIPFERVLFGLGIRYVGETVAKVLAKHFKTIDAIITADMETMIAVDEIGDKIAESVILYFSQQKNIDLITALKNSGLQFVSKVEDTSKSEHLKGIGLWFQVCLIYFLEMSLKK